MLERVWFTLLGPVRAWHGEREIDLGPPQQRAVMAILLAHGGQPVGLPEIVDMLWWQDPPESAVNSVHRSIGQLRRALEPQLAAREAGSWLVRAGGGYRLSADAENVDLLRFRDLIDRARAAGEQAVSHYAEALQLWRGGVAEGIGPEVRGNPVFTAISREYVVAAREAADVALTVPGEQAILPLVELAADRAILDEPLQARVVNLLAVCGRQTDALERFDRVRGRLRDELGLDPGGELVSARDAVLRPHAPTAPSKESLPRPAQLPADLPAFVGRSAELAILRAHAQPGRSVVIKAIGGMAGIGKTSLAVHVAHQVAEQFPDGQLYANLRGFDPGGCVDPSEVLKIFLESLGVAARLIPQELDGQAALFRSKVAGRRFLIVLDNARDTAQVRPLLPGTPSCLVVVTSRDRLTGLVASQGAWPITLSAMGKAEARQLLSVRSGEARLLAEPDAVEQILAVCAGLPIALTIVAARAATRPGLTLGAISAGLRDAVRRLDTLTTGDPYTDVRSVFSWSYEGLAVPTARLFRLLGLPAAPDISLDAAASLAGIAPQRLLPLLAELIGAALISERPDGRYVMHDLLRAYAAERAAEIDPIEVRQEAVGRLLDHYIHSGGAADRLLFPQRRQVSLGTPRQGVTLTNPSAAREAADWFGAEQRTLRSAIDLAAEHGFDLSAWQVAWVLQPFINGRGFWGDLIEVETAAIEAARRLGDPGAEAYALRLRGDALTQLGRFGEATDDLREALRLAQRAGDPHGEGYAHASLGEICDRQGRHSDALSHAERAVELFQLAGDKRAEAYALGITGWLHGQLGNHELARDACRQALTDFEVMGDRGGQSSALDSLGVAHQQLGDHREAVSCFDRSLEIVRDFVNRYGEASVLSHRGDSYAAMNDHRSAREDWRQALEILEELRHADADGVRAKLASQ